MLVVRKVIAAVQGEVVEGAVTTCPPRLCQASTMEPNLPQHQLTQEHLVLVGGGLLEKHDLIDVAGASRNETLLATTTAPGLSHKLLGARLERPSVELEGVQRSSSGSCRSKAPGIRNRGRVVGRQRCHRLPAHVLVRLVSGEIGNVLPHLAPHALELRVLLRHHELHLLEKDGLLCQQSLR